MISNLVNITTNYFVSKINFYFDDFHVLHTHIQNNNNIK